MVMLPGAPRAETKNWVSALKCCGPSHASAAAAATEATTQATTSIRLALRIRRYSPSSIAAHHDVSSGRRRAPSDTPRSPHGPGGRSGAEQEGGDQREGREVDDPDRPGAFGGPDQEYRGECEQHGAPGWPGAS